jgi:hypothetical protein
MNQLNILENTPIGDIVNALGIDNVLINAGTEASYNLGQKVGRISASPSKNTSPEVSENIKVFKSSFIRGFVNGYFRNENGTLNWSIIALPVIIVIGLIFLIRKI